MKIKLKRNAMVAGCAKNPGDVVDVNTFLANDLISQGKAEVFVAQKKTEPQVEKLKEKSEPLKK